MQQNFKMLPQRNGLSLQSPLRPLSVLIFHLLLTHSCRGQSQLIGSSQPIVATVGDDIILPCHLEPAVDVAAMTLDWTRSDLDSIFVLVWRAGQDYSYSKDPSYKGRTSLFTDELKRGNISLKLSDVRLSDAGRYRCFIPKLNIESVVELVVGAASSPVISLAGIDRDKGGVVLQCESAGWHPEPEVLWLDGEGKLLSAGPTETVRGPDDLYTVSSRVTVEKRHSNSFTCRVQQRNINQTTETHISMSDDFFKVQSSPSSTITGLAVSLAVCILFILLLVFFVCKRRNNRTKTKRSPSDERDTGRRENPSGEEMESLEGEEEKINPATDSAWFEGNQAETIKQLQVQTQLKYRAQSEVKTLKNQLETKIRELETSQNKEAVTKRLLDTKTSEWTDLKRQLQEERMKNINLEKEVKTLKQDIQMKDTQLQEEKKTNTNLEKEVMTLKQDIKMKDTQLQVQTQLKDRAQSEVQTLKNQLETKRREEAETKRQLDTKTSEWRKLQTELQEEKKKNTNLEKEVKTLKQDIQMKDTQLQEEKTKNTKLEKEVKTLKQDIQMKDTQLQGERTKNTKLEKEVKTLKQDIQMKDTQLQEEEMKNINLEIEVKTLKQDIQMKDTQLQDEHTRREEAERQVQRKRQELQKKTQELQVQTQLKDRAQSEVQTLKNQLETKIREMEGKQPETIRQLPQGQEEAKSEVQTLKNQLETKRREFEKQLQDEKKKKTELEKKLKTLEEELQKNNTQLQGEKMKNTELEKELETLKEESQNKDRQGVRRRGWSFWRKRRP
ncbi:trichohyalin-like [Epinephelus fuscoguttatus]|uniref:trichohyalin-like n=1 Tax=Epinephelus fuscoguttatus TaxID=293821 RepID=UPI0020D0FBD1|nr:trichohyalin-like [Epinephelus fuscoguttatus]